MIYLANTHHTNSVLGYLQAGRAGDVASRFNILTYQDLFRRSTLPRQATIFTDHERFTPAQLRLVTSIWDTLGEAGVPRFNDPRKVLRRPELLALLHQEGINNFGAWHPGELPETIRFPVFVREAHEHSGTLTKLIPDRRVLKRQLALLTLAGFRSQDLLVVEFCDVSDDRGIYRKYAAFRVGDAIFPRCVDYSRQWMVKSRGRIIRDDLIQEELAYMHANPHEDQLRKVYELSGIDYGRVDYGVKNGAVQVWEINTNPQIGPRPGIRTPDPERLRQAERRKKARMHFYDAMQERFREVAEEDAEGTVDLLLDADVLREAEREFRGRERRIRRQRQLLNLRRVPMLRNWLSRLANRS